MKKNKETAKVVMTLLLFFCASASVLCRSENAGAAPASSFEGFAYSARVVPMDAGLKLQLTESDDKLPLSFLLNRDQITPEVYFLSNGPFSNLLLASAKQADEPKVSPNSAVLAEFDQLITAIATFPALNKGQQSSLTQKIANGKAAYGRGQTCTALNILDAYLNETQALRKGSLVSTAEQLYGNGRFLGDEVLRSLPGGIKCERHASFGLDPAITLDASDNTHVAGRIRLGEAEMWPTSGGGEQFTKVTIAGVGFIGPPGLPGVPTIQQLIAVPHGATVEVYAENPTIAETVHLNLYPFQTPPFDQTQAGDFSNPPFVKDSEVYASKGPFPSAPCTVTMLGPMRDLMIARLTCAAGRYDPVDNVLTLFSTVAFDVRFEGGDGYFLKRASVGAFEPPIDDHTRDLLNRKDIMEWVDETLQPMLCAGEEFLIFTPPDLKPAADKLADWKREKGIVTSVVVFDPYDQTGSTPPVRSKEEINSYVKSRYDRCSVRPSYILLFGDAERIPTWYVTTLSSYYTASDYPYAIGDMLPPEVAYILAPPPSFAVGRIPVWTLDQAGTVVNKIIAYEKEPPSNEAFYQDASILARFECCKYEDFPLMSGGSKAGWDQRSFIENAEYARNVLLANGYTVERIYTEAIDTDHYFGDPTPRFYKDGSNLPQDLKPESGFDWLKYSSIEAKNQVLSAFNTGRFLILQRNHGSWNGWASWQISRDDVDGLTNGPLQPVVFSMSCSTAFFDSETDPANPQGYPSSHFVDETYFGERLIRHPFGAIGFIGATRDSNVFSNDVLTRGLFDAVWPEPVDQQRLGRLGDILNHGKLYLLAHPGAIPEPWHDDVYLYQVLGDPTLEMWTAPPLLVLNPTYGDFVATDKSIQVKYDVEGAIITAFQMTEDGMIPIGRGVVKDGVAMLDYVETPREGSQILLSAGKANAVSVLLTPGGIICDTCDVR